MSNRLMQSCIRRGLKFKDQYERFDEFCARWELRVIRGETGNFVRVLDGVGRNYGARTCVRGSEIARKDLKLRTEVPKRMFYYGHYQEDMPLRYVMEDDMQL